MQNDANNITSKIIGAAIEVHKTLGVGLLEDVYRDALLHELRLRGLKVEKEVPVPVVYKGIVLSDDKRVDLLVEDEIVVELKSVIEMKEVFHLQVLTYLRLLNKRYGLLINFNVPQLKEGIWRKVNGY
ncbi:MAG: GxxExxY protein [Prevotellaceae bacterium]|nr:GxxExxY protein [Candidatus Minthosoma caballi]